MAGGWLDAAAWLAGSAPAPASQFMPTEQAISHCFSLLLGSQQHIFH